MGVHFTESCRHVHGRGTYPRKTPAGVRIARWYCPKSHTTFGLLPDCLAARLPGTLGKLEEAMATAARSPSEAAAAGRLRASRLEPPDAMRWLRRQIVAQLPVNVQVLMAQGQRVDALLNQIGHAVPTTGLAPGIIEAAGNSTDQTRVTVDTRQ